MTAYDKETRIDRLQVSLKDGADASQLEQYVCLVPCRLAFDSD